MAVGNGIEGAGVEGGAGRSSAVAGRLGSVALASAGIAPASGGSGMSSSAGIRSTETTSSLGPVRKMVTPCVPRPATRMPSTGHADELAAVGHQHQAVAVSTGKEATSLPLRALIAMATMPLPPRPVTRYSKDEVRLP